MEELKERIRRLGVVVSEHTLKLDEVLNHQVEPRLIMELGKQFALRYRNEQVTKVVTIESSGIAVGFATALELDVPLVFARRKKTLATDDELYWERVPSFTKGMVTDIIVSKRLLRPEDRVLLIDDIIANGDAARGLIRIIRKSGAHLVGLGIVVEKSFQAGARTIRDEGYRVESLVRIKSLKGGQVEFE